MELFFILLFYIIYMKQCIVIIPIYQKTKLNKYERMSIINTIDKFNNIFDIVFITGKSFDLDKFYEENDIDNKYKIDYIYFLDDNFKDVDSYNRLLLSESFYLTFENYKYMLIVQTDAYIFNQYKIFDFINKEYNFIGAPVVIPDHEKLFYWFKRGIYYNGGLSLRNIQFCIDCLNDKKYVDDFFKYNQNDEDILYSSYEQELYKSPTYIEALQFSIDNQINLYAPILNFETPFGTHHFYNDDDNQNNKLQYIKDLKWID